MVAPVSQQKLLIPAKKDNYKQITLTRFCVYCANPLDKLAKYLFKAWAEREKDYFLLGTPQFL